MLVTASIVGICLLAYAQLVVKIPTTIVFACAIPILSLSILIGRMMLYTTGAELSILRPVMIGSDQEFGYLDSVLVVLKLRDPKLIQSCMSHMTHVLQMTRENPVSNTWSMVLTQISKVERGEMTFERFEEFLGQIRILHRSVGTQ